MTSITTTSPTAPHASRRMAAVEAKLLLRERLPLFWGIAVPMALLTIMSASAGGPDPQLGALRLVAVYEPVLIAFVAATFAMQGLPIVLANYRERDILAASVRPRSALRVSSGPGSWSTGAWPSWPPPGC
jgi:hypothetical protein